MGIIISLINLTISIVRGMFSVLTALIRAISR